MFDVFSYQYINGRWWVLKNGEEYFQTPSKEAAQMAVGQLAAAEYEGKVNDY